LNKNKKNLYKIYIGFFIYVNVKMRHVSLSRKRREIFKRDHNIELIPGTLTYFLFNIIWQYHIIILSLYIINLKL
jgi:hypothetical protein